MKSPFVWGKNGEKLTPEDVERQRLASAMMYKQGADFSPAGHWSEALGRAFNGWASGRINKIAGQGEKEGLASADEAIAALLAGRGGAGGGVYDSTSGGRSPSGTWTPDATPGPVAQATQGVTGGLSFPGQPAADTGVAQGGLGFGAAVMTPQEMLIEGARRRGLDPIDVATAISYETGGKFDPMIAGPTTQWGTHRGLIQFGEPQAKQNGVDFSSPDAAWASQLNPDSGAVWNYLESAGVKPGMGLPEIYSGINAGSVGRMGASDANNGGAPGTVADKVAGMGPHREKAAAFLGGTWTPDPNASVSVSTKGGVGQPYGGGNVGGMDIASLLALQSDPWVAKKYGGVVDALMGQQFSRQNALWEQQQKMADPMYQAQLAELTAPKPVDPFAGTKEVGGVLYGPDGQGGFVPLITPPSDGAVPLTDPADRAKWGIPPTDTRPYAVKPGEVPKVVGGDGVTVNNNMGGGPELGKLSTDFGYVLDPETNLPRIDPATGLPTAAPVPGSPAAIEAARLAEKEGNKDNQGQLKLGTTLESINLNLGEIENGGLPVAGIIGDARRTWVGRALTGDSAVDFGNRTNQITDQAALAELQNMRDNSPTGGAVGQLTDNERRAIGNSITAINNSTSPEEYARAAKAYRKLALDIAYGEGTWELGENGQPVLKGAAGGGGDAPDSSGIPAGIDPADWQFMTPEERALFQ